jgi:hypothetical protein
VPPPHLVAPPAPAQAALTCKSPGNCVKLLKLKLPNVKIVFHFTEVPKISSSVNYFVDGVYLSEIGNHKIRSLTLEQPKKKRNKNVTGKGDAGILATIESVVSGGESTCCTNQPVQVEIEKVPLIAELLILKLSFQKIKQLVISSS